MASEAFAVITGGGTAGHVLPALAIADGLRRAGHTADSLHYVGARRGVETTMLPTAGLPHTFLDVIGLQRSLSVRNLLFAPKLVWSTARAVRLVRRLRPRVVVNVGGYASFPATFAAKLLRVPYVVVSYDRRPGLVSRLLARGAAGVAVAFEGSALPGAVYTGAPIRHEIATLDRLAQRRVARERLGLPLDRFVVGVACGSLGAQVVNDAVRACVERWSERDDLAVYHVVGERFLDAVRGVPSRPGGIDYRVVGFEQRIVDLYAAADVMVTRGGAGTVAEIAAAGVPAIMIPWPGAAENHQLDNVRTLSAVGAAILIEQDQLTPATLMDHVNRLRQHPDQLVALAAAARAAGAKHRSGDLVALIERLAR